MSKFVEFSSSALLNVDEIKYVVPNLFNDGKYDIHLKDGSILNCISEDYFKIKNCIL